MYFKISWKFSLLITASKWNLGGGIIHNNNQFQFFTELIGLILIKPQRAFHN